MSEIIQVDIVTPEKKIFSEKNVLSANVPGIEGDLEILNNHIPIITFLKPGRINIEVEGSKKSFFISESPSIPGTLADKTLFSEKIFFSGVTILTWIVSLIYNYAADSFAILSAFSTASSIVPTI